MVTGRRRDLADAQTGDVIWRGWAQFPIGRALVNPEVMGNAIASLKNSGILDRVLKTGDRAPQFELQNAEGVAVSSADILKKGPMVLNFYRGAW